MDSRPIGQHENFFHVAQHAFECLDVMVSRLTIMSAHLRDVSHELLLSVHRQVTQRHPMLRCRIMNDGEYRRIVVQNMADLASEYAAAPPVCLESRAELQEAEIQQLMASELQHGFTGPLFWRLTAIRHPDTEQHLTLLIAVDHTVGDGISCVSVAHDVLKALAGNAVGPELPFLPSCSDLLSASGSGTAQPPPSAPTVHYLPTSQMGVAATSTGSAATASTKMEQRWVTHSLDAADVAALGAACRRAGTTVTGALTAATIQAMRLSFGDAGWAPSTASHFGRRGDDNAGTRPTAAAAAATAADDDDEDNEAAPAANIAEEEGPRQFLCFFAVSLRRLYGAPISDEQVGFHFGGASTWWEIVGGCGGGDRAPKRRKGASEPSPELDWALAVEAKARLGACIGRGEPMHLTAKPASDEALLDSLRAAARGSGRTKALTLSNRGRFELPCELVAFQHTTNIEPCGPSFQLSAVTLNGTFFMTLAFVTPHVGLETGSQVADRIMVSLRTAARAEAVR